VAKRSCSVDGCERKHLARGFCPMHYQRWRSAGAPGRAEARFEISLEERFWPKVGKGTDGECWEWRASRRRGYGQFKFQGRALLAHRVAYELLVGPIPAHLELDHLCRNRACVNPAHLEPVTHAENVQRGELPAVTPERHRKKTHCPAGHPYPGDNLYVDPKGKRYCRACSRDEARRYRARKAARP